MATAAAKLSAIPVLAGLLSRSSGHSEEREPSFEISSAPLRCTRKRPWELWRTWQVEAQIAKSRSTRRRDGEWLELGLLSAF